MEYIIASMVAILAATLIVYKLANSILGLGLRLRPLLLCAACAMFISLVLPRIVVGFAGLPGTVAVLAVFAIVFAYFVAKYEGEPSSSDYAAETETASCIVAQNQSDIIVQTASVEDSTKFLVDEGKCQFEKKDNADIDQLLETQSESDVGLVQSTQESISFDETKSVDELFAKDVLIQEEILPNITSEVQLITDGKASIAENVAVLAVQELHEEIEEIVEDQIIFQDNWEKNKVEPEQLIAQGQVVVEDTTRELVADEVIQTEEPTKMATEEVVNDEISVQEALAKVSFSEMPEVERTQEISNFDETKLVDELFEDMPIQEENLPNKASEVPLITEFDLDLQKNDCPVFLEEDDTVVLESQALHEQPVDSQVVLQDNWEEDVIEPAFEHPIAQKQVFLEEAPGELVVDEVTQTEEQTEMRIEEAVSLQLIDEISGQEVIEQESLSEMPEQSIVQEDDCSIMADNEQVVEMVQFESEELDDLLEFAFISKESHDYNSAFNAFSRALTLYPNSEAAPFLIVEIGNILKNRGAYDDAIKIFSDGRNLSQTRQDGMMEQEFISTIAYLRITKNILLQNRLGNVPFIEIPSSVLEQIDEEFKEWRNVGNI